MDFIASGPAVWVWASSALVLAWWIAGRLGSMTLSTIGISSSAISGSERRLFSLGLGIIVIALGVLAIGLAGLLTRFYVAVLLVSFAALPFIFNRRESVFLSLYFQGQAISYKNVFLWALIALPFSLSWVQALMPATGTDALAYHLFHPKQFVLNHRIFPMPYEMNRESLWPYQTEMLFTLGLLFQGASLAQLFHWAFYPLTAAAVYLLTRRLAGARAAFFAALIFIYTPAAFAQSSEAYVDLSLAFFSLMAVYLFLLWENDPRIPYLFLAGLFAGSAAGTKFLGLGSCLILFILISVRSKMGWKPLFIFVAACALTGGIWYARSWWVTGNPVYPLFPGLFGGRGVEFDIAEGVGMGKGLNAGVLLLWNMTLYPRNFGGEMQGPLFLLFLPALFLKVRNVPRNGTYLTAYAVLYTFFLFSQSHQLRFFLSSMPFWSVGAAIALDSVLLKRSVFLKRAALGALAIVLAVHMAIFFYRLRDSWSVFFGQKSASVYLMEHDRSFKAHVYLGQNVKPGEKLFVSSEVKYFYGSVHETVWDTLFLRSLLDKKSTNIREFLDKERFEYIWLVNTDRFFFDYVKSKGYELVYTYDFTEKPATFHNFIYKSSS